MFWVFFAISISKVHYHHCLLSPPLSLISFFCLCCHYCANAQVHFIHFVVFFGSFILTSYCLYCCFFWIICLAFLMFGCHSHNITKVIPCHVQVLCLQYWNVHQKVFKLWKVALLQVKSNFIINVFQSNTSFYINQNRLVTSFMFILVEFKLIQLF